MWHTVVCAANHSIQEESAWWERSRFCTTFLLYTFQCLPNYLVKINFHVNLVLLFEHSCLWSDDMWRTRHDLQFYASVWRQVCMGEGSEELSLLQFIQMICAILTHVLLYNWSIIKPSKCDSQILMMPHLFPTIFTVATLVQFTATVQLMKTTKSDIDEWHRHVYICKCRWTVNENQNPSLLLDIASKWIIVDKHGWELCLLCMPVYDSVQKIINPCYHLLYVVGSEHQTAQIRVIFNLQQCQGIFNLRSQQEMVVDMSTHVYTVWYCMILVSFQVGRDFTPQYQYSTVQCRWSRNESHESYPYKVSHDSEKPFGATYAWVLTFTFANTFCAVRVHKRHLYNLEAVSYYCTTRPRHLKQVDQQHFQNH